MIRRRYVQGRLLLYYSKVVLFCFVLFFFVLTPPLTYDPQPSSSTYHRANKFVLEIDDETDEDVMSVLLDKLLPDGIRVVTSEFLPEKGTGTGGRVCEVENICMLTTMMRVKWNETGRGTRNNQWLSGLFQLLYLKLCENFEEGDKVVLCGLKTQVNLTPDNMIELVCTCMAVREEPDRDEEGVLATESRSSDELKSGGPAQRPLQLSFPLHETDVLELVAGFSRGQLPSKEWVRPLS